MMGAVRGLRLVRAYLDDAITEDNTLIQRVPANVLAKVTGFRAEA